MLDTATSATHSTQPRLFSFSGISGAALAQLIDQIPVPIAIWHLPDRSDAASLVFSGANPASHRDVGGSGLPHPGQRMIDAYPTVPMELLGAYAGVVHSQQPRNLGEITFATDTDTPIVYEMHVFPLDGDSIAIVHTNITAQREMMLMLQQRRYQEEIILAQEASLAELSTPLLAVADGVVVMPLIGTIDSRRAMQVIERLLAGVSSERAHTVILDITGIPVVDTQVANALIRAAQAVRLLGSQVILTGIRPEVAQTLVGLGIDLSSITTRSTLQRGIAEALA